MTAYANEADIENSQSNILLLITLNMLKAAKTYYIQMVSTFLWLDWVAVFGQTVKIQAA